MLVMIGLYTAVMRAGASVNVVALSFGAVLSLTIGGLWWYHLRSLSRVPAAAGA
jgi:hypothetical protein